jgi:hypothetical protein
MLREYESAARLVKLCVKRRILCACLLPQALKLTPPLRQVKIDSLSVPYVERQSTKDLLQQAIYAYAAELAAFD